MSKPIELSNVLVKGKKKETKEKGKALSVEIVGSLAPELNIVILRDKK